MPEPAAKITSARYRAGTASASACKVSTGSGSTRDGVVFGRRVPSHGFATINRSRTAARKMPDTTPWTTPTVDGANRSVMPLTHAWTSLGLIDDIGLSPRTG